MIYYNLNTTGMKTMKTETLFVDEILEEREKSWLVKVGSTTAWLAKKLFTQLSECQFEGPKWLINKIEAAA